MREVMRGFRQKIKLIETQAGEQVDKIMVAPILAQNDLAKINAAIVKMVMGKSMDALKEGVEFGRYVKSVTPKA